MKKPGRERVLANMEIRAAMQEAGLYQWEVAFALGISEMTLARWLRTPMTEKQKEQVLAAIAQLTSAEEGGETA